VAQRFNRPHIHRFLEQARKNPISLKMPNAQTKTELEPVGSSLL
jgi:hypothetical protein